MAYDLKHAIIENKQKAKATPNLGTPPSVNPAPNQPNDKDGGLSTDDFEKQINNEANKNTNVHSTNEAANNPKNNNQESYNFKHNGINNPNDKENNINPKIPMNHTPYQRIAELAEMLERYSLPVQWERSFPCPCLSSSGYPQTNCPICHGLGLAFMKPLEIGIAFQHDNRQFYNGKTGIEDIGEALATPQITENGIESGIAPRDRFTIDGMTVPQTFIFNVSKKRINQGEYIPYRVNSIDLVTTKDNSGNLVVLHKNKDFTFNYDTFMFRPFKKWLNHNISIRMSVTERFYVTNTLKETRYATTQRPQTKQLIFGKNKPNKDLTNYMRDYNRVMQKGEVYIRMPKLLEIRRENIVLGNEDFDNNKKTAKRNTKYKESKVTTNPTNPLGIFGV